MGEKAAGSGTFQIPTAPAALTAVAQSASANTLGSAVSFGNAPSTMYITGVFIGVASVQKPTYVMVQILAAASIVGSVLVPYGVSSGATGAVLTGYRAITPPIPVASGVALTVKTASDVASAVAWGVSLECIAQSNVVDDGVAVGTVTNLTNAPTAGDLTATMKTSVTAAATAATPTAAGVASGGITSSSFAAGAINAAAVATDAIDADAISIDAVTEIQAGLASSAALSVVQTETSDIQARLPSALVGGRMNSVVAAYASGQVPLQPTVVGRTLDVAATGEAGLDFDNIHDASGAHTLSNITVPIVTTTTTATNLTNAPTSGDLTATMKTSVTTAATAATPTVTAGTVSDKTGYSLSSAGVQAIWDALTSGLTTVGSIGKLLVDNVNATISSRSSHSAADVWAVATRLLTAGTNIVLAKGTGVTGLNDLDAAGVRSAVGLASANLDTQVGELATDTDSIITTLGTPAGVSIAADLAEIEAETDGIAAIPTGDTSGVTTLLTRIPGTVQPQTGDAYARLGAPVGASISADIAEVEAETDAIATLNNLSQADVRTAVGLGAANLDTQLGEIATDADTLITGVVVATNNDKVGYALTSAYDPAKTAAQAGDAMALTSGERTTLAGVFWAALTSGFTTVGSIGKRLADNVDAAISSRLASGSYTAPDNADITAIKAKTDNLPVSPAAVSDVPTATQNADALLDRADAIETGWSPRQALRIVLTALGGKLSGAGTGTETMRNVTDTKDRIVATDDANGNRSDVTLDPS